MLRLRLFSRLQVTDSAAAMTPRLRPRAQRLLAYLLLRRADALGRESVAFTLWPDQPEAEALGALRRALSDLRTGLPGGQAWVLASRDELRWNGETRCWLDVELFERWLTEGSLAAQHDAVALYSGDLLAEWDEDWVLGERERLRQRQMAALRQLVAHHRGLADYEAALGFARQSVALDPLAEAGYRELMSLRYATGDRGGALAEYERLRMVLRDELGVEPMPASQALAAAISRGEALAGAAAPAPVGAGPPLSVDLPPLVGREDELARLNALWESAAAGHGRIAIVGGQAGVGKSHLGRHLAAYAARGGGLSLIGHCYEFERALPHQALAEMLRAVPGLLRATDLPLAHRRSLARLVPEVFGAGPVSEAEADPATDEVRAQLYEALLQACLALARSQPLLLLIEDAHWAAESTLDWLTYAAPRLDASRLLIVITYRADEVGAEHALARLGRRFAREGLVTRLALYPLSRAANRLLVAQLSGLEAPQAAPLADRLHDEAAGNPFFLHELVRGLLDAGLLEVRDGRWAGRLVEAPPEAALPLPEDLRATITARVERLSPAAQQLVRAAAVAGRVFAFDLVGAAGGWPEDEALTALEELLARGFVSDRAAGAAGEYFFAHHLVQEVLVADLAPARRASWHRRLAEALQARRPDDFEALAYHFFHAGAAGQARAYYLKAGDRAARLAALDEAAAHYAAALAGWPHDDPAGRAATWLKRGQCLWVAGELNDAMEAFRGAHELYQALGDSRRTSEVLRLVGRVLWEMQERANSLRYYNQALQVLEGQPESVELARAVSAMSQMHMLGSDYQQAMHWGRRALDLAERLGAADVHVHALNNVGSARAHLGGGDREQGLADLRESQRQAAALNLTHDASRAYLNLSEALRGLGRLDEARQTFASLRAYASRMQTRKFEEAALARGADLDWQCGRWASVLAAWDELLAIKTGPPGAWVVATLSQIDIDLGRPAAARDRLENTLDRIMRSDEIQTTVPHLAQWLRSCEALGDTAAGDGAVRRLGEQLDQAANSDWGCAVPALLIFRWLLARRPPAGAAELDAAFARLERVARELQIPEAAHALAEARGLAALAAGQLPQAIAGLQQAGDGWRSLGLQLDELRALDSLAQAQQAAGSAAAAGAALAAGQAIVQALAAQVPEPGLRQTFLAAGLPARLAALPANA